MYPFILTTFAGLATLIGVLPIFVKINDKNKLIGSACAFASGVMVCVSVLDLIPESFRYLIGNYHGISLLIFVIISLLIGIITSYFLEKIVDSVGSDNMLYKVGVLAMLVIIIHNIPEGIVTYVVSRKNIALGIPICIAIALHNVPEGISIAIPIYFATGNKFKAVIYTLISAMSELLGAIITSLFLTKYINNLILGLILSFTAGIMLQISINKLLPTSNSYCAENAKRYFIIGFIFMLISLLINNVVV
jgi:ZIP family zinc transporter